MSERPRAPRTVAVLMTSFNRRSTTLRCLTELFRQDLPPGVTMTVILVDDASRDGTAEAVRAQFPSVRAIVGTGDLYWVGGMHRAFSIALAESFDAYLWLNDDTMLRPGSLRDLFGTLDTLTRPGGPAVIVVGATADPASGAMTYGGIVRASRWHPLKFALAHPGDDPVRCTTMNGNVVLIPSAAASELGNLDPAFIQGMGDIDYGLRAERAGVEVWMAAGFVGACPRNPAAGTWEDASLGLRERWRLVCDAKGLPPKPYRHLARRHAGTLWPLYWGMPYARLGLTWLVRRLRERLP